MMPEINFMVLLSQIVSWVILAALIVAAFLVGRDARRRGHTWLNTIGWAVLTLFIFPIGLGLYFLCRTRNRPNLQGERS